MDRDMLKPSDYDGRLDEHYPGSDWTPPTPQAGDELARELRDLLAQDQLEFRYTDEEVGQQIRLWEDRIITALTASGNDVLREKVSLECRWCGQPKSEHLANEVHPQFPICPQEPRKHDYFAHYPKHVLAALSTTPTMSAEDMREAAALITKEPSQ